MELRHLRCFVVMAEELHFGRAAERLHVEPSPLSRSIKALEDELGVALFVRSPRGTHISATGRELVEQARRILALVDQLKASAVSSSAGAPALVRVGLLESFSQPRLAELIARTRADEPNVEVMLFELPFPQQVKDLRAGLLDVCLTWSTDAGEHICSEALWSDRLVAVLPQRHLLARQGSLSMADLARETLLLGKPERESGSSAQFAEIFSPFRGHPIHTKEILTSLGMVVPMVAAGHGIVMVLEQQAEAMQHPDVVIRPLVEAPVLTTYLLRAEGPAPSAVQNFIKRAQGIAKHSGPDINTTTFTAPAFG